MNKISRLRVSGFRRLRDLDLEARPLTVLIGANSSGKTSLLDAFRLLSASAAGRLKDTLDELGGVLDILTRGRASELTLTANMEVPGHEALRYELTVAPKGVGYVIPYEMLSQKHPGYSEPFKHIDSSAGDVRYYEPEEKGLVRPDWEHDHLETSLSQVPKMFRQPEELRKALASATQYHALEVGPRAPVRMPQQMKPANLPGANGQDLVPLLYYLRESSQDRYEALVDSLRAAFPNFECLSFPPVAAGVLAMTWKDKDFDKPFYLHELSEGTLRFLWLASLLQSPGLSTVTMIDEPEVSLHPELLGLLAGLMREAAHKTQLIVATHSERLVRFLEPNEVVVMDVDKDGFATATWADSMDLEEWLGDYSLDELWAMGRIGGRA